MEYIEWFGIIRKLEICSFKKISEEKDEQLKNNDNVIYYNKISSGI